MGLFDDVLPPEPKQAKRKPGLFDDVLAPNAAKPDFAAVRGEVSGPAAPEESTSLGDMIGNFVGKAKAVVTAPIRGLQSADYAGAAKRGTAGTVAGIAHTLGDFVDQTTQALPHTIADIAARHNVDPALVAQIRDPLGARHVADQALAVQAQIDREHQEVGARPALADILADPAQGIERYTRHIAETGTESAPLMLGAIATRNPELASGLIGGGVGAQEYATLRGQGVDRLDAAPAAALTGLVESAGEGFALENVMGSLGKGSLLRAALAEGGQEVPVQLGQQAIEDVATGHETPIADQLGDALDAFLVGAGMGGTAHVALNAPAAAANLIAAKPAPIGAPVSDAPPAPSHALGDVVPAPAVDARAARAAAAVDRNAGTLGLAPEPTSDLDALVAPLAAALGDTIPSAPVAPPAASTADSPPAPEHHHPAQIAAAMRQSAQEQAARAIPTTAPTTASAVQPSVPVPAPSERAATSAAHEDGFKPGEFHSPEKPLPLHSPLDLRGEVGWAERGGMMIRGGEVNDDISAGASYGRTSGDVVGRTPWVGKMAPDGSESTFWRNRPVKLNEREANTAFDKFERGEPLTRREQGFIDYAQDTARSYAEAERDVMDDIDAFSEGERQRAIDELRDQHAIAVDHADHNEALAVYELAHRAAAAGIDDFDIHQASNESDRAYAARLWPMIQEAERGTDPRATQGDHGRGDQGRAGGPEGAAQGFALDAGPAPRAAEEVARPAQSGLFAPPTRGEHVRAATEAKDAQRNGLNRDLVRPEQGGGELLAGDRPAQADVATPRDTVRHGATDPLESVERIDLRPTQGSAEAKVGDTTITYGVSRDGKTVEVVLVRTPKAKRGEGSARRAMEALIAAADANGQRVVLTAEPMDASTSKSGLESFYRSLGFKPNKGRARDFSTRATMIREPHSLENTETDDLNELLRTHGEPVDNLVVARGRFGNGDRVFGFHELDEEPTEIRSSDDLKNWAPDQLLVLSRFHAPTQESTQAEELSDDDLTPAERAAFGKAREDSQVAAVRERARLDVARRNGEADADANGLRAAVEKVLGPAGAKVKFIRGLDGLPGGMRKNIEDRNATGRKVRTAALFDPITQDVYLLTDVVRTADRAAWNAAHEIAGHMGLRGVIAKRAKAGTNDRHALDDALDIALQNPTVSALADAIAHERKLRGDQVLLAAEEALAELAAATRTGDYRHIESRYGVSVPEAQQRTLKGAIARFVGRIKAIFDRLLGNSAQGFSDADVQSLIEGAWRYVREEAEAESNADEPVEQVVFHGTPHTVDKFSLQKIGTGEGAQAYGWGMYFASNKAIAQHYRKGLSTNDFINKAREAYSEFDDPADAVEALREESLSAAQRELLDALQDDDWLGFEYPHQALRAAVYEPQSFVLSERTKAALAKQGNLYRVDVPEDSDLLDWDKPLSQQPAKVKDALEKVGVYPRWREQEALKPRVDEAYVDGNSNDDLTEWRRLVDELHALRGDRGLGTTAKGRDAYMALGYIQRDKAITEGRNRDTTQDAMQRAASEALNDAGVPGLRYLDGTSRTAGEGSANYVIWDEALISEPEALESVEASEARAEGRRDEAATTLPVSRGTPGWNYDAGAWEGRKGALKSARAELQDKMLAFRDVQGQIESSLGHAIDDAQNVYRLENLMHGRVSEGIDRIERDQVEPLAAAMKAAKVDTATLDEYLYARHAKERNAQVATINPKMPDGGSGMTNAEADAILAKADTKTLEPLAKRVDAITRATRKRLLDHGLITQEAHDAMASQYSAYVPLRGKAESKAQAQGEGARGVDSRRAPVKRALGRGAGNRATNILGEVIGDAQRSVILAEKARVGRAVMRLVLANPNPALWEVEPVQTERDINANGEVYERVVNDWSDPSVVAVRHKGQLYRVQFHQPELAKALNHVGVDQLGTLTRAAGALNRYFSAVLTKYNPAFVPVNATRDAIFGLTGMATEHGEGAALDAAVHYLPAARAAWRHARGVSGSGQWDAWAREFAEHGGKTGYVNMPSVEELQRKIGGGRFGGYTPEGAAKAARAVADTIGHLNDGVENALRLSAYVTLRKRGASPDAAAEYAKNLTVNFNRKGFSGSKLNAWFLFFNAAMQGSHRVAKLYKNPKTYAYLGALTAAQVIATLAALGMKDDDGEPLWNKVPDHVKRRNLVIVTPDGGVITIPMPYGFNVFPYLGGRIAGALADHESQRTKRDDRPAEIAADAIGATVDGLFPIPLSEGPAGLVPEAVGIPLGIQTNRDDFGRPIHREDAYAKSDVPLASLGRPDTLEVFKLTAKGLNRLGGGDELTPPPMSALDVAPEDIEYLLKRLTGGTGQFVVNIATVGQKLTGGEYAQDLEPKDIPIANRFRTNIDEQAAQQALFYQRRDVIERSLKKVRAAFKEQGEQGAESMLASLPELKGAAFKRRKRDSDNGKAGSIVTTDGMPQIIVGDADSVFGAYKRATDAITKRNDAVESRYDVTPASPIPTQESRERDAFVRTEDRIRQAAQDELTRLWTRDVVGVAEDGAKPVKPAAVPAQRPIEDDPDLQFR